MYLISLYLDPIMPFVLLAKYAAGQLTFQHSATLHRSDRSVPMQQHANMNNVWIPSEKPRLVMQCNRTQL